MDIAKIRKKALGEEAVKGEAQEAAPQAVPEAPETAHPAVDVKPQPAQEPEQAVETVELLTFSLASEEYAFRVRDVQEIIKPQRITRIPRTDSYIVGITSLRGKIIPVLDLKKRLALPAGEAGKKQKILIVKGPNGPIGAFIDKVNGVVRPTTSQITEAPPHLEESEMRFIEAVALLNGRFISIVKAGETMNI